MNKPFTETIHSDFLIHWIGKDIDKKLDKDWNPEKPSSRMAEEVVKAYIDRLENTLKFGLWMKESNTSEILKINGNEFDKPKVARTCFTELKLSEVRKHAQKFGRLGIGLKRYYVFDRLGGPMHYLQPDTENLFFPPYLSFSDTDKELISFFKPMCSKRHLTYDLFSESEWRIIYSENIKDKIKDKCPDRLRLFVDPRKTEDKELLDFYNNIEGDEPKYLLPLDALLSIIIYPSPEVKNAARNNSEIQEAIKEVKSKETIKGCPKYEKEMWPIEVDLDACSHF